MSNFPLVIMEQDAMEREAAWGEEVAELEGQIAGLRAEVAAKGDDVAARDAQNAGLHAELQTQTATLEAELATQRQEVAERDAQLAGLQSELAAQAQEVSTGRQGKVACFFCCRVRSDWGRGKL